MVLQKSYRSIPEKATLARGEGESPPIRSKEGRPELLASRGKRRPEAMVFPAGKAGSKPASPLLNPQNRRIEAFLGFKARYI